MSSYLHFRGGRMQHHLATASLAGLVGGVAEIGWISLYSAISGGSAAHVAAGITGTFNRALASSAWAVPTGLAIHLALAIGLGLAVTVLIRQFLPKLAGTQAEFALVVATLAVVWAVNFLVILPLINPSFVHAVPMTVSFASKLLFGVGAGLVLLLRTGARPAANNY